VPQPRPQPRKPWTLKLTENWGEPKKLIPVEKTKGENRLDVETGRGKRLLCSNEALRTSLWEAKGGLL